MQVNSYQGIAFGRKLRRDEQTDAQNTMQKALNCLGKEFGMIIPDSMAPCQKGEDTGMNSMTSDFSQNLFLSFLLQNGIKLNSIQDVPNGLRKKTDPSPFVVNASATDVFKIDLKAMTTEQFGKLLSPQTYKEILKENENNNAYYNNFTLAVKNRDRVQKEIYQTFLSKLENFESLTPEEQTAITEISKDFEKIKQEKGALLTKYALYDILTKIHDNDYYPNWGSETDKKLFDEDYDEQARSERIKELKSSYKEEINAFIFGQALSEKFIKKEVENFSKKGINIYNDIPIAFSESEVWAQPNLFSKNLRMGSKNNFLQLWDFAIPDPEKLFKADGSLGESGKLLYEKYKTCFAKYKFGARIDHVLGFINPWIYDINDKENGSRYYSIFFNGQKDKILKNIILPAARDAKIDTRNIIAEDLGYFKDDDREILKELNCTTMNLSRYKSRERVMQASENSVAMMGSHDDITVITQEKLKLPKDEKIDWKILKQNIKERFIDLFTCPSKKVQIFISDVMGMTAEYKPFECSAPNRWLLRTTPDTFDKHYQDAVQDDMGFNMPEILLEACKRKTPDFVEKEPELASKLQLYSDILKEKE